MCEDGLKGNKVNDDILPIQYLSPRIPVIAVKRRPFIQIKHIFFSYKKTQTKGEIDKNVIRAVQKTVFVVSQAILSVSMKVNK